MYLFTTSASHGKIEGAILDIRIDFLVADFVSGLIHIILCLLLFKIKRFKYGFTFLKKEIPSIFGIIVAVLVPIVVSLSNIVTDKSNINYLIPLIYLCFSGFVIVFWALFCIKREYIGNIRIRDTEILHRTIVDLQNEVNDYKDNNEKLAKIIHRDNKEIPALELLVEKAIMSVKTADTNVTELEDIESNLKKLAKERKNIVLESERHKDAFKRTSSILLNSTLSFMYNRAFAQNTKFEVSICDLSLSNETEYHINTILANLLENAIFATETVEKKMIKVKFSNENEILKIFVFDSGQNFNIDFFKYFGMFKYTSRKKKGGSGIGTMSTIELCKNYNASYTINENVDSDFTKYVSIEFDGKSEIRIFTSRQKVIEICKSRGDILCFSDEFQTSE